MLLRLTWKAIAKNMIGVLSGRNTWEVSVFHLLQITFTKKFKAGNDLINGKLSVYKATDTGIEGLRPEYADVRSKHIQEVRRELKIFLVV